jgi:hypothetical protein
MSKQAILLLNGLAAWAAASSIAPCGSGACNSSAAELCCSTQFPSANFSHPDTCCTGAQPHSGALKAECLNQSHTAPTACGKARKLALSFNVSVAAKWKGDHGCKATAEAAKVTQGQWSDYSQQCDSGPITWAFTANPEYPDECGLANGGLGADAPCITVTYKSRAVMDASPPTCSFSLDFNNSVATASSRRVAGGANVGGCFTTESREGFHMTGYNFDVTSWHWADEE